MFARPVPQANPLGAPRRAERKKKDPLASYRKIFIIKQKAVSLISFIRYSYFISLSKHHIDNKLPFPAFPQKQHEETLFGRTKLQEAEPYPKKPPISYPIDKGNQRSIEGKQRFHNPYLFQAV